MIGSDDDENERHDSYRGNRRALDRTIDEAQKTLGQQIQALTDIDAKAIKILRVNVAVIAILLSALTLGARSGSLAVKDFWNIYFGIGFVGLLVSTTTAALTYRATDFRVGVDSENVERVLENDLHDEELLEVLAKSYARWIEYNVQANVRNAPWITATILILIAALAYLSLGIYHAVIAHVSTEILFATNLVLLGVVYWSGLPSLVQQYAEQRP